MTDVRLVHYSKRPLKLIRSTTQEREPDAKPHGLWVSDDACEQNWRRWCEDEQFGLESLANVHDVALAPTASILRLSSPGDIDAFHEEYTDLVGDRFRYGIHWAQVAAKYDGILITPYIWERRLAENAGWYYGWDCASGCIWNAKAVAAITLRAPSQSQAA